MKGLEGDTGNFENDALMNRKPMKFTKRWCDVIATFNIEDDTGEGVLDGLESFYGGVGKIKIK